MANHCARDANTPSNASKTTRPHRPDPTRRCCLSVDATYPSNIPADRFCDVCFNYRTIHPLSARGCSLVLASNLGDDALADCFTTANGVCIESMRNYNTAEYVSYCCRCPEQLAFLPPTAVLPSYSTSIGSEDILHREITEDLFVRDAGGAASLRVQCKREHMAQLFGWMTDFDARLFGRLDYSDDVIGLACQSNRTLRFLAMDLPEGATFADGLGIDVGPALDTPALVIVNNKVWYGLSIF